jgi:hypothetical protein
MRSLREIINQNSAAATLAAVVVLVLALGAIVMQLVGGPQIPRFDAYYYDLESDELFIAESGLYPPIEGPSGDLRGVKAYVLTCGDCPSNLAGMSVEEIERTDAFIGWFEIYESEVKQALEAEEPDPDLDPEIFDRGPLAWRPGIDERPMPRESEAFMKIEQELFGRCPGDEFADICTPN